jgi:hypothetical protein
VTVTVTAAASQAEARGPGPAVQVDSEVRPSQSHEPDALAVRSRSGPGRCKLGRHRVSAGSRPHQAGPARGRRGGSGQLADGHGASGHVGVGEHCPGFGWSRWRLPFKFPLAG